MRVDGLEVQLTGDQEDDGPDGGQASEAASATLGGLEQAVDGLQESIGRRVCAQATMPSR